METHRRIDVHYSGTVQGVGFRYRTRSIALQFNVLGFVRNLDDGRVQVVAEGEKDELLEFLREVDQQMARYVRNKNVVWLKSQGQFASFEIRA